MPASGNEGLKMIFDSSKIWCLLSAIRNYLEPRQNSAVILAAAQTIVIEIKIVREKNLFQISQINFATFFLHIT